MNTLYFLLAIAKKTFTKANNLTFHTVHYLEHFSYMADSEFTVYVCCAVSLYKSQPTLPILDSNEF